mmetsp:Transcript_11641/g.24678  ORF Transcript_11641/g.24678 Transcript_11641/m.24678 type:complete len:388 (+) Transcript_11641:171-1334(+)
MLFINTFKGVVSPSLSSPLKDCVFLQDLFIKKLLQDNSKVLRLFCTQELACGDEVTLHNSLALGNLRNSGGVLFNLLLFEEVNCEGGTDENVDSVLRLQTRCHLLVNHFLSNGRRRCIRIVEEELFGGRDCKSHGIVIIHSFSWITVVIAIVIAFSTRDSILEVVVFVFRLLLLLFVLLVFFGILFVFFLIFLLLLFIFITAAIIFLIFLLLFFVFLFVLASLLRILLLLLILRKNVSGEFMAHIHHLLRAACHALVIDAARFDFVFSFRQAAVRAQDKKFDVLVHQLLENCIGVGAVHNGTIAVRVVGCLTAELASKELVHFAGVAFQTQGHVRNVRDHCFDTISAAFNFPVDSRHPVAVLRIINRGSSRNVHHSTRATHVVCFVR